jgi:hypothetical protein
MSSLIYILFNINFFIWCENINSYCTSQLIPSSIVGDPTLRISPHLPKYIKVGKFSILKLFHTTNSYLLCTIYKKQLFIIDNYLCFLLRKVQYKRNKMAWNNLIKSSQVRYHIHVVLIQYIKELFFQTDVSIFHTLREENQCADFFAKPEASSDVGFLTHISPYKSVRNLLKNDAMNMFFL